ncbi:hypothetical protein B0H67DRAFT_476406 [Lasiosphaeris hirsuta]|uniref:Ribosomal protein s17 n=1 Tax=Lasiosphaeris hirsuta TaxID=260670 RepID=A0AA40B925_9PEZI|nr:hypothetical protein B0H67DRAFT_476406 [Lasiosphaeris hirsuta]
MLLKNTMAALLGLAVASNAASLHSYRSPNGLVRRQNGKNNRNGGGNAGGNAGGNGNANGNANAGNGGNNDASVTCLAANAVQTGSQSTGQNGGVAADGQVNSATDPANFINFCSGETLTNGLQNRDGSCNGIPMGKIPSVDKMVSTVILNPKNGDNLDVGTTFTIQLNVANVQLGAFTNATSTYYSAPQDLNGGGTIIGHTHVTVQDTGNSLNPQQPLDAKQFVFFKGINDAGNGQGLLSTDVTGGLPAGNYRLCTMSSASNHQPVLMPVAQRGSQEDCKYFTVGAQGGNGNNNNNAGGQAGNAAGNGNANAGGAAQGGQGGAQGGQGQDGAQGQAGQGNGQAQAGGQQAGNGGQAQAGGQQAGNGGQAQAGGQQAGNGGQAQAGGQQAGNGGQAQAGDAAAQAGKGKGGKNNGGKGKAAAANAGGAATGAGAGAAAGAGAGANANANAGGAIGGIAAPAVEDSGNPDRAFKVGANTFVDKNAAVQRACAIQNNACADAVNSGAVDGATAADCNQQEQACRAAGGA